MSTDTHTLAKPGNDLRSFIAGDKFKEQVALALPKHMTPDRFARVALTAFTKTPKLLDCTRESLLQCLMTCSQLGIEPDGRHAHLIPFENRKAGTVDCQLIVDYKGLIALARRSGDVSIFKAEIVKENDGFDWLNGAVKHTVDWRADRGKSQAVYSYVKFKDGSEDWDVMTLAEVDAVRKRSRAANVGPWVTDFDEMAKKTVLRRHSKRLTLSPEFMDALDRDDDRLDDIRNVTPPLKKPALLTLPDPPPAEESAPLVEVESEPVDLRAELNSRMERADIGELSLLDALKNMKIASVMKIEKLTDAHIDAALSRWPEIELALSQPA